jgi:tRNA nucleotidyltransferase (CCA-adding enzyme)
MPAVASYSELSARFLSLPGAERLLSALDGLAPCYLVGGAVRDLLLGAQVVDLDIAVEGDAEDVALHLAERLGGSVRAHGRFGTATVHADGLTVDLAGTRRETYAAPGALPDVEPAPLAEDLDRRDFTINALALALEPAKLGEIVDPQGGRADLEAGLVRVLHPESFIDDPTRLLRAVRYAARFGFALEPDTERWARDAVAAGALSNVSGPRICDELMDLLAEDAAPDAIELARDLGIGAALHPALVLDPDAVASAKLGAIESFAEPAHVALAALCVGAPEELAPWIETLGLVGSDRDAIVRAAGRARELAAALRDDLEPSGIYALLLPEPPEALALALANGAPAEPLQRFITQLRGTRLEITGTDLLAAGLPESPALGEALELTLVRKLNGEISGRDEELAAALEIARRRT